MGKFTFIETSIKDLYIVEPTVYGDARGYFMETFNDEFAPFVKHLDGTPATFVQDNESHSRRGVLRGLHFQKSNPQGKLVRVLSGEVFDVAVDLRRNSETFGKWEGVLLSGDNKRQFYVPEGFAHGFLVLSETATFAYKCTRLYAPADEGGLLYNDPALGIDWPTVEGEILLSDKDKKNPTLGALDFAF
ncbi:MAG: dTDP-4-dehydrorhamnose 3,5-epimerase [Clostridia bacterium]|nr:dTDP-4-dehydrorhamnose 3,5-epimerase [Clostridia bacterium]